LGHPVYKNESPFVSLAKTQKRLDRFECLFFSFVRFNTGGFKKKKKLEKLPGQLENSGKTESAFFYGNGWNDLANFFLMFKIIRMRFSCKEKLEKLPGKLGNSGKTESTFFYW
jgi:hypothetical protein